MTNKKMGSTSPNGGDSYSVQHSSLEVVGAFIIASRTKNVISFLLTLLSNMRVQPEMMSFTSTSPQYNLNRSPFKFTLGSYLLLLPPCLGCTFSFHARFEKLRIFNNEALSYQKLIIKGCRNPIGRQAVVDAVIEI